MSFVSNTYLDVTRRRKDAKFGEVSSHLACHIYDTTLGEKHSLIEANILNEDPA